VVYALLALRRVAPAVVEARLDAPLHGLDDVTDGKDDKAADGGEPKPH